MNRFNLILFIISLLCISVCAYAEDPKKSIIEIPYSEICDALDPKPPCTIPSIIIRETPNQKHLRLHKWIGFSADLGLPEGAAVGIVFSPYFNWLKLTANYTNNYFSSGGRTGVTIDALAFIVSPSLNAEYGFTDTFNPSDIVGEKLPRINYRYVNIQPGIEFGSQNRFRFFFHAGWSHLWAHTKNFRDTLSSSNNLSMSDPKSNVWFYPSFKLGVTALVF